MAKPHDDTSLVPLDGHTGNMIDQLLGVASREEPMLAELLRLLRLRMRTVRPEADFGWSADMRAAVVALSVGAGIADRARRAISDAVELADGTKSSGAAQSSWSLPNTDARDSNLELAHFRTTESFEAVQEKFTTHIEGEDVWGVLLRGHLWIEIAMNGLIERASVHPEALGDSRMSFSQKASLARALGQLTETELLVIRRLNKVRNRLAHDIEASVTESDQTDLVALYSQQESVAEMIKGPRAFPDGIAAVIVVLFVGLNSRADLVDAQKRYDQYMHQRVLRLLGKRHPDAAEHKQPDPNEH